MAGYPPSPPRQRDKTPQNLPLFPRFFEIPETQKFIFSLLPPPRDSSLVISGQPPHHLLFLVPAKRGMDIDMQLSIKADDTSPPTMPRRELGITIQDKEVVEPSVPRPSKLQTESTLSKMLKLCINFLSFPLKVLLIMF